MNIKDLKSGLDIFLYEILQRRVLIKELTLAITPVFKGEELEQALDDLDHDNNVSEQIINQFLSALVKIIVKPPVYEVFDITPEDIVFESQALERELRYWKTFDL
jgi:hypothetical protein